MNLRRVFGDDQNLWNFLFSLVFLGLFVFFMMVLGVGRDIRVEPIPLFDFFILALAVFRLIRLFSYDKITQFLRDFLYDYEDSPRNRGASVPVKTKPTTGPRRTLLELLECPWCTGVWLALFVVFFYFYTPLSWFPLLVLAIAGIASFFQLTANMVGWTAEHLKQKTLGK